MFNSIVKTGQKVLGRKPKPAILTGYRHGGIGAYTGEGSAVAWKALDHEYSELGNDHLLRDVARFLKVSPKSWEYVLRKFRSRYGNRQGIWLSKTLKDSDRYQNYGDLKTYRYYRANVICDLGEDGIFVILGAPYQPPETGEPDAAVETLDVDDQPVLEPAPDAVPARGGSSKRKRNYMFYPSGLGARKE